MPDRADPTIMNINPVLWLLVLSCFLAGCSAPPTVQPESRPAESEASTAAPARSNAKPLYNLEKLGEVINPLESPAPIVIKSDTLTAIGWAVDGSQKTEAGGVDLVIDGKPRRADYGQDRPDVAKHFGVPAYAKAGFTFSAPTAEIGRGAHKLAVRVVSQDGKTYSEGVAVTVDIR